MSLAIPLSLSVAFTFTFIVVSVTSFTVILTSGSFPSNIVILALFPAFVPSVNLAYTVFPWFKLPTVTGLFPFVQLPVVSPTWYSIWKLVVVVNVMLAFPPLHTAGLAVIAPVTNPASAPGTVAVV